MATKKDDHCLIKAKDDEPLFVLRGQDKTAPVLVILWLAVQLLVEVFQGPRLAEGRMLEAFHTVLAMRRWPTRKLAD